jgi:hypothetical protein
MRGKTSDSVWCEDDEGSHYPITREWWTFETLFSTPRDQRKWNLMLIMAYNLEKPSCFFQYTLFDISNKKCVLREDIDDDISKLTHLKKKLDLAYEDSTVKGGFPEYVLHLDRPNKGFRVDIDFHARSAPHWIAQDVTNGVLPFGFNFYKYGYIPNSTLTGKMLLANETLDLEGKGYIEHVWGDWSYENPFSRVANMKKTLETYKKLGAWWLSHHQPRFPDSLGFTTENNMFGYDWAWGVFDNDWSVFFGNILFWLYEGPAFGVLTLTPDGMEYWDFCDISYRYNKVHYVKEFDIYFASDIELDAWLDDKQVHLRFFLNTTCYDYIDRFEHEGFYKAFILSEMPGEMIGWFQQGENRIELHGDCKLMPLRQPSSLGHNALRFVFLKPPKGFGVDIDFNSHYLQKHFAVQMHLLPKPRFQVSLKRIEKDAFTF